MDIVSVIADIIVLVIIGVVVVVLPIASWLSLFLQKGDHDSCREVNLQKGKYEINRGS